MSADVPVRGLRVGHLQPYVGSGIKQADVPLTGLPESRPAQDVPIERISVFEIAQGREGRTFKISSVDAEVISVKAS
jgi:hypothetical protein